MSMERSEQLAKLKPPPKREPGRVRDCETPGCCGTATGDSSFCPGCQRALDRLCDDLGLNGDADDGSDVKLCTLMAVTVDRAKRGREAVPEDGERFDGLG